MTPQYYLSIIWMSANEESANHKTATHHKKQYYLSRLHHNIIYLYDITILFIYNMDERNNKNQRTERAQTITKNNNII